MVKTASVEKVQAAVLRFVKWLDQYGETSYDHQSFFASDLGRGVTANTLFVDAGMQVMAY